VALSQCQDESEGNKALILCNLEVDDKNPVIKLNNVTSIFSENQNLCKNSTVNKISLF
jgi:hypothetical protein